MKLLDWRWPNIHIMDLVYRGEPVTMHDLVYRGEKLLCSAAADSKPQTHVDATSVAAAGLAIAAMG